MLRKWTNQVCEFMFQVIINGKDYAIPETASEMKLSQFIPFDRVYRKLIEYEKDITEPTIETTKETIIMMVEAVHLFFKETHELEDIGGIQISDFNANIRAMKRIPKEEKSLRAVFNALINAHATYVPPIDERFFDGYHFSHKGMKFTVSENHVNSKTNLSVSESIEVLEAQRISLMLKEKHGADNVDFSRILHTMAVICRAEGEMFPMTQAAIDEMIEQRINFFTDITMDVAYDIAFFLTYSGLK